MNIPCIGHLSAEEIISVAGFDFSDFKGKSVLDIGCGFSDFLITLRDKTEATRLVGVDPIFETPNSVQLGVQETREYIGDLMGFFELNSETINKLRKREISLAHFSQDEEKIQYYPDISCIGGEKFDYIFISFVFRHLDQILQQKLLNEAYGKGKIEGVISIIDGKAVVGRIEGILGAGSTRPYNKSVYCLKINR